MKRDFDRGFRVFRVAIVAIVLLMSETTASCLESGKKYSGSSSDTITTRLSLESGPSECQLLCRESTDECYFFSFWNENTASDGNRCKLHLSNSPSLLSSGKNQAFAGPGFCSDIPDLTGFTRIQSSEGKCCRPRIPPNKWYGYNTNTRQDCERRCETETNNLGEPCFAYEYTSQRQLCEMNPIPISRAGGTNSDCECYSRVGLCASVSCDAVNQCVYAGLCEDGVCVDRNIPKVDGTSCDDGDAANGSDDRCANGICKPCGGAGLPDGECDCNGNVNDPCGVCGGDSSSCTDACGVVNGDNSTCSDCSGVPHGQSVIDVCGVCGGPGIPLGDCDCDGNVNDPCGVCGGDSSSCTDACGVVNGDNSTCSDCSGVPHGQSVIDVCGVCGGPGIPLGDCDCDGNVNDPCGVCGGDSTSCQTTTPASSAVQTTVSASTYTTSGASIQVETTSHVLGETTSSLADVTRSSCSQGNDCGSEIDPGTDSSCDWWCQIGYILIFGSILICCCFLGTICMWSRRRVHKDSFDDSKSHREATNISINVDMSFATQLHNDFSSSGDVNEDERVPASSSRYLASKVDARVDAVRDRTALQLFPSDRLDRPLGTSDIAFAEELPETTVESLESL